MRDERLTARVIGWGATAGRAGAFHLALSIVCVQGAAYVAQLLIAHVVSPADFGIVRTVESALAILALLAQAGMPSIALREGTTEGSLAGQGTLLRRFLLAGLAATCVIVVVVELFASRLVAGEAAGWLRLAVGALVLTTATRIGLGFFQSVHRVTDTSLASAGAAVVGLVVLAIAVQTWGLTGWIYGRYAGEALQAATIASFALPYLRASAGRRVRLPPRRVWASGSAISLSLLIRTAQDSLVVVLLGWLGVPRAEIGYYGLGAVLAFPVLLLPGVVSNLSIPRYVRDVRDGSGPTPLLMRSIIACLALSVSVALSLLVIGPILVRSFLPEYQAALPILTLLLLATPLRAMPMAVGGLLIALDRNGVTAVINLCVAALTVAGAALVVPQHGARGAALVVLAAEALSLLAYMAVAARAVRASTAQA